MTNERFDEMVSKLAVIERSRFEDEEEVRSYLTLGNLAKELDEEVRYTQEELDELADEIVRINFWMGPDDLFYDERGVGFYAVRVGRGLVKILEEDGSPATRVEARLWPVGSQFSSRYDHPEGIFLLAKDARRAGIPIEED
jgi:hypothetical protein